MEWHQRSLQSMTLSDGTAVSFQYNADGIRTKKTADTTVHSYVLDGSTILKETITTGSATTTLYYYYDESGVSGLEYNGTKYSYVKNLQGDVIGIIDANGITVVEYKYDAWGNILSVTGSMASTLGATNPFRYRGYYYDTESGWYYLNSRYYDPQVGRFINADGIVGANGGIMGYNLLAYCSNNPVMCIDPTGYDAIVLLSKGIPHIGALIQDRYGNWWHFYWGTDSKNYFSTIAGDNRITNCWLKPYSGSLDIDSINASGQYDKYKASVYLHGDFSASVDRARLTAWTQNNTNTYSLYDKNCSQVTFDILAISGTKHSFALRSMSTTFNSLAAFSGLKQYHENLTALSKNFGGKIAPSLLRRTIYPTHTTVSCR